MENSNILPPDAAELKYLELLSQRFPSIAAACSEIINLEAIINLPKGTEHFLTDLHGEHEAFRHVLRNASGVVRMKVNEIFGNLLRESEKTDLCTLVYYPEQKIELLKQREQELEDWYRITLNQLIEFCRSVSSKYTRSKVRKALPAEFAYIIEELLHESQLMPNKHDYYNGIINSIIAVGRADDFIIAMCNVIQRLTIDSLHIVGDVYDRGPGSHQIMDILCGYHNVDIQWGNHDVLWMGAAAGSEACIANVLRQSIRYGNLEILEDGYGVNLLPLATFAMEHYGNDPCEKFQVKNMQKMPYKQTTLQMMAQMHKALTVLQFKAEAHLIARRPQFGMESRNLLHKVDFETGEVDIDGVTYKLDDRSFPTVDPADPYAYTEDERELMAQLRSSFLGSERLERHIHCMYSRGSLYLVMNGNLIYHASIPMNEDGTFKEVSVTGHTFSGKAYMDEIDRVAREAYFAPEGSPRKLFAEDMMWYLWCGPDSPLFDKDKMATFERYLIADKASHREVKGAYYRVIEREEVCDMIFREFGLDEQRSHIINGHIPVKPIKGESPIKAHGKLLVIDGGFSKAYQPETGIAGYTLMFNSYGMHLVQHEPFESTQKAISEGQDIRSTKFVVESNPERIKVRDTNIGRALISQICELQRLLWAYRSGFVKEKK